MCFKRDDGVLLKREFMTGLKLNFAADAFAWNRQSAGPYQSGDYRLCTESKTGRDRIPEPWTRS